jgi:hypothetical protein
VILDELRALAGPDARRFEPLFPHLSEYCEFVLAEEGLEVITGGRDPRPLAVLARTYGGSADGFLRCAERFPGSMLWFKAPSATLYVRTVVPMVEAARFLPVAPEPRILYAVGFCADGSIKSYVIDELPLEPFEPFVSALTGPRLGFVSRGPAGVKFYLPDVPWDRLRLGGQRWTRWTRLGQELGFRTAGHLGVGPGARPKVYVDRIGTIPNDYSQR